MSSYKIAVFRERERDVGIEHIPLQYMVLISVLFCQYMHVLDYELINFYSYLSFDIHF